MPCRAGECRKRVYLAIFSLDIGCDVVLFKGSPDAEIVTDWTAMWSVHRCIASLWQYRGGIEQRLSNGRNGSKHKMT